jgi:SAM-dependent methyltransferase
MYNPRHYWEQRGRDYRVAFNTQDELENLKMLLIDYGSCYSRILEVGSGNGRLYDYLIRLEGLSFAGFEMCDFVDSLRMACYDNIGIVPTKWDGYTLPYLGGSFNWVLSFSVFLHVPPSDIERVFAEHVRVCATFMFVATYHSNGTNLAEHCFVHDYHALFRQYNMDVVHTYESEVNPGRMNWLLKKRYKGDDA